MTNRLIASSVHFCVSLQRVQAKLGPEGGGGLQGGVGVRTAFRRS